MSEGLPVDERATEMQVFDAALQFVRRGGWILQREMGEAREAVGVARHARCEIVVGLLGAADRQSRVLFDLNAGSGDRKDGPANARGIHLFEPERIAIKEPPLDRVIGGLGHAGHRALPIFDEMLREVMLLDRDLAGGDLGRGSRRSGHGRLSSLSQRRLSRRAPGPKPRLRHGGTLTSLVRLAIRFQIPIMRYEGQAARHRT